MGLSPRLRGNLDGRLGIHQQHGSIPALAGEPKPYACGTRTAKVYPRACGGTALKAISSAPASGLSPRLRGNPAQSTSAGYSRWSIPALAGEPFCRKRGSARNAVYPRACGGTRQKVLYQPQQIGLSPRLRGNLHALHVEAPHVGSIPALAGEPLDANVGFIDGRGLSPRLRGNQDAAFSAHVATRSIPALAGEPSSLTGRSSGIAVYPRACGGTSTPAALTLKAPGLSPRLRGNQPAASRSWRPGRSIPALAGEPLRAVITMHWWRVYPRACGGTHGAYETGKGNDGLSPRLRGNPYFGNVGVGLLLRWVINGT